MKCLIPVPYPECVFEYRLDDDCWYFLLIKELDRTDRKNGRNIRVQSLEYEEKRGHVWVTGIWVQRVFSHEVDLTRIRTARSLDHDDMRYALFPTDLESGAYLDEPPPGSLQPDLSPAERKKAWADRCCSVFISPYHVTQWMSLMLMSRTTELRVERPPSKLVRAQIKSGKTPLRDHTTVVIVPDRYREVSGAQGGHPRLATATLAAIPHEDLRQRPPDPETQAHRAHADRASRIG